jgi:transcriptional regulator with XRE-family HTH domain
MRTQYMNGSDLVDKMLELSGLTQKELSKKLKVSEAAISGYRKSRVSRKSIRAFLKEYPHVSEEEFYLNQGGGYIKNLQTSIGLDSEGTHEFAEVLTNVSAIFGTKKYIQSLKDKEELIKDNIFYYRYSNIDVSGPLSKSYRLKELDTNLKKRLQLMPIGFCSSKDKENCKNCFSCPYFITTKEFLPVIKSFKLSIEALNELTSFKSEEQIFTSSYYSKDINSVLADFVLI